jgi:hypothetical protein
MFLTGNSRGGVLVLSSIRVFFTGCDPKRGRIDAFVAKAASTACSGLFVPAVDLYHVHSGVGV